MSLLPVASKVAPLVASSVVSRAIFTRFYSTLGREHVHDTTKEIPMPFIGERLTIDSQTRLAQRMRVYQAQAQEAETVKAQAVPHVDPEGIFMQPLSAQPCEGAGVWEGDDWGVQPFTPRIFDVFDI